LAQGKKKRKVMVENTSLGEEFENALHSMMDDDLMTVEDAQHCFSSLQTLWMNPSADYKHEVQLHGSQLHCYKITPREVSLLLRDVNIAVYTSEEERMMQYNVPELRIIGPRQKHEKAN